MMLTKEWQNRAKAANIPYETEWFVVTKINKAADGKSISYKLVGSMGGGWEGIDWNEPNIISHIQSNFMNA